MVTPPLLVLAFLLGSKSAALPLYTLQQVTSYGATFFFDAEYAAARFTFIPYRAPNGSSSDGPGSSVLVYANGAGVKAVAQIDTWVDLKGHLHSVAALKRQDD